MLPYNIKLVNKSNNRVKVFTLDNAEALLSFQLTLSKERRFWSIKETNKYRFDEQKRVIKRVKRDESGTEGVTSPSETV
jgi:fructose-1,6-bisphosphatase